MTSNGGDNVARDGRGAVRYVDIHYSPKQAERGCCRNHMSKGRSHEKRGFTAKKTPLSAEHPLTEQLMSAASLDVQRRSSNMRKNLQCIQSPVDLG